MKMKKKKIYSIYISPDHYFIMQLLLPHYLIVLRVHILKSISERFSIQKFIK